MSTDKNWPAYGNDGKAITATNGVVLAALIATTSQEVAAEDVLIYNPGPLMVQIKCGKVDAEASALSVPVPPKSTAVYAKGANNTHMSTYCEGTQAIVVWCAQGA